MGLVVGLSSLYLALTPSSVARGDGNTLYWFWSLCCWFELGPGWYWPRIITICLVLWDLFVWFCCLSSISLWTTVSIAQKALSLFLAIFTPHGHLGLGTNGMGTKDKLSFFISKHVLLPHSMTVTENARVSINCPCLGFLLCFANAFYGFLDVTTQLLSWALNSSTKDF